MASVLALTLTLMGWAMPANAERLPVVFVVDAALDQRAFDLTGEILLETSSQLPDDTVFSVVVYDEVIQAVIPLAAMDKSRLSAIMRTLEDTNPSASSNLAAGFERALDALKDTQRGHIVFFTSAQINAQEEEQRKQYLEWYEDILLPDSALKDLSITIVSTTNAENNPLLQVTSNYQHIEIMPMTANGATSTRLLAKLKDSLVPATAMLTDQATATQPAAQALSPAEQAVDAAGIQDIAGSNGESTSKGTANARSTEQQNSQTTPMENTGNPVLQNKNVMGHVAMAAIGAVVLLFCGLLIKWLRGRNGSEPIAMEPELTGKSAYLPLDENPSGRLTSHHVDEDEDQSDVSIANEEARWTNKWTGHADAAAPLDNAEQLASEDTTHISVSKPPTINDNADADADATVPNKLEEATRLRKSVFTHQNDKG